MTQLSFSECDHVQMARALRLAERGLYTTQPNPRVGCVIAKGGEVIGEGWHMRAGEAHAEVLALTSAGERARGATAYVTLEPCGLHGRTPPCADALIVAGIARIVVASEDTHQQEGGAPERLRAAGIVVDRGLMREAARELNRGFFSRVERGRPWLRVKLAASLDGRTALANGASKWITGEPARADVQRWRARSSAILTGIGTVLADDPRLTVRAIETSPQPGRRREKETLCPPGRGDGEGDARGARVVIDRRLRTPRGSHVLDGSVATLVLHAADAAIVDDRFANVEPIAVESSMAALDLDAVVRLLAARGMNEVQVEAGPTLCGALFNAGLVDEMLLYVAPLLLGDAARPLFVLPALSDMAARWNLRVVDRRQVGDDSRLVLRSASAP